MKNLKHLLIALLITSPLFIIVGIWSPHFYIIIGQSMEPSLHERDRGIVLEGGYDINRFDIVIISSPSKGHPLPLVKRVVGLPGEVVEYVNGVLAINGKKVEEPFLPPMDMVLCEQIHTHLGENEYFVMGDNRNDSWDSRSFGPVPSECIIGKLLFKW